MAIIVILYGSVAFCILASLVRIRGFLRAPVHLRWEIYNESRPYKSTRDRSERIGRLQRVESIAAEILFLRAYWRQPGFWLPLFMFHLGAYLLILWHIWLFTAGATEYGRTTYGLVGGHIATAMAFVGGLGVVVQRLLRPQLRARYPVSHYLKWLLILVLLVQGFLGVFLHFSNNEVSLVAYVGKQLSFDWTYKADAPLVPSAHVVLASLLLLYLPFSHASRLIFRYYHELRWDHVERRPGSSLEKNIAVNLARPVTWSGRHIGTGRTWSGLVRRHLERDSQ